MNRKNFFKVGIVWAAVLALLIFAGCLGGGLPGTGSELVDPPDTSTPDDETDTPDDKTPPLPQDDPDKNTMTLETGNKIFALVNDAVNNGWRITGFKSALQLGAYLDLGSQKQASRAVAAAIVNGRFEFTIPVIGGKSVTSIGEGAFTPGRNGNADITSVVHTIHIPATIVEMAKIELGNTAEPITVDIPKVVLDRITEKENIKEEEVVTGDKATVTTPSTGGGGGSTTIVEGPPVLKTTAVSYNPSTTNPTTVTFTFENVVTAISDQSSAWTFSGTGTKIITAVYNGNQYGTNQAISFTAASSSNKKTKIDPMMVLCVQKFPAAASADKYIIKSYDSTLHTAVVQKARQTALDGFLVADAAWQKLFNAIYTPNAPGTTDDISFESDKKTITYNGPISEAVLNLFQFKIGGDAKAAATRVEITGTELPTSNGADEKNLIVIDLGVPGTTDNKDLNFVILDQGLGTTGEEYQHLRLRVNKGADLVIRADNSGYINGSAGDSCPTGLFTNGCVEVMEGGKLRDGAYEGFPLGSHAVLLNRYGSYLGIGPEEGSDDAKDNMADTYGKWYSGWLVGPITTVEKDKPKIEWDKGGKAADYLEVREGELATSTNMTVKKTLGLIYSVWLLDGVTVTIDAKESKENISGGNGLFANGSTYKIYGKKGTAIDVKQGSVLHQRFLTAGDTDIAEFIAGPKKLTNGGTGTSANYASIPKFIGYLDWSPLNENTPKK
jgi:hypothetical protein